MSQADDNFNEIIENVDLTNCDREPIHILGRVQSFGFLIAVTSDWMICHASRNIDKLIKVKAEKLIGTPLSNYVNKDTITQIRKRIKMLSADDAVERIFNIKIDDTSAIFDVAIHVSGSTTILEFEHHHTHEIQDFTGHVRSMIDTTSQADSIDTMFEVAAELIRELSGMDRVMVYRFDNDGSGEVIAESKTPKMDTFRGLRFPASDIPKQARALYVRNFLRIISDSSDEGIEIIPALNPKGKNLDLSMSTTRAVSPVHLEYLRNMGIKASMSISILRHGKLWGLFACHHNEPLTISYPIRSACELFAQMVSYLLDQKTAATERKDAERAQILHDKIMAQLAEDSSVSENFYAIVKALKSVVPHDGAAGWIDGQYQTDGRTPGREEFMLLLPFLNTTVAGRVFETDNLSTLHPTALEYPELASGILVLPVSRTPRDFIVLFRQEIALSVTWAGNPEKPIGETKFGNRLTPRKSFEAWQQIVRNHSAPWTEQQIRTAEAMRITLMEVVMRMADANLKERERSQAQQELLIAELNHRVRNILNLIRSIINQSASGMDNIESFTDVVGGRIHALARAHDQITHKHWAAVSLSELIITETNAFVGTDKKRVHLQGIEIGLVPGAFSTMALVIHELTTNSAKYGALSVADGRVKINISRTENGDVNLNWQELDGPEVEAPTRRGFGTTIIERSVPFELKGATDVKYEKSGLTAQFIIPKEFIKETDAATMSPSTNMPSDDQNQIGFKTAMVVEDNLIIALDAETFLKELGAETVIIASNVREAIFHLEHKQVEFALLDVNLGTGTSLLAADWLWENKVPFAFATGYGELSSLQKKYSEVPIIQKPYDAQTIREVLSTMNKRT